MELAIANSGSKKAGTIDVSDAAFAKEYNEDLIHQVVTAHLSGARQGTRAQKNRAAVRGGGRKPFRQKGTGRARAGTIRSPIWRSGGVTFAAKPQDHSQKVNRKMYRAALRSIFSELARQERLVIVEDFDVEQPKTKLLVGKLTEMQLDNVLIIGEELSDALQLSSRNLHKVGVCEADGLDPVSLVAHDKVLVTVPALRKIEEYLA